MKRLLEGDGSEVERGLLDALRVERPSPELEQRMRAAIGLAPISTIGTVAPEPSAPTAAAVPATKTVGWGAIAAGSAAVAALVGGVLFLSDAGSPSDAPAPQAHPVPVTAARPVDPEPSPTPAVPAESLAAEPVLEPAPAKPRPQHVAPTSASLREEIRLIDSARVAVKKNEGTRALGILDQYARRFPSGTFREEARVLRAEALKSR
jgi:cell division septation protein DedD